MRGYVVFAIRKTYSQTQGSRPKRGRLCWKERQTIFVTVNRYIQYAFMKAKVPTFILIYSASVFLLLALSWRCRSRHVHCGPQWQKVLICE